MIGIPKDFLSITDLQPQQLEEVLFLAKKLKTNLPTTRPYRKVLKEKSLYMITQKPSSRTTTSFFEATIRLGGNFLFLDDATQIKMGVREPIKDFVRSIRGPAVLAVRVNHHKDLEEIAKYSSAHVINALTDLEHPCQALADLQTMGENTGPVKGKTLAFVGDANNVAHSLLLLCSSLGVNFRFGHPKGYELNPNILKIAQERASETGAEIYITNNPIDAVKTADVVEGDTWVSMGQEREKDARLKAFSPYIIDGELMNYANPGAIFLHCLPRGAKEVTDEVFEGPQSRVFEQANNRIYAQMGLIAFLMRGKNG